MTHGEKTLLCTVATVILCTTAARTAETAGNPYTAIVDRNVFGLKPPPPPPDPEANKPPPPKIFLTGITTILGNKRALLKTTPPPGKPGEPPKEEWYTLGEGQREGDIEVLAIDEKSGTVKVDDFGTITTLNFDSNGVKTASAPAPAMPGAPHPGFTPPAGGMPFAPGAAGHGFTRPMHLPTPAGADASPASRGLTPVYASGNSGYGGTPAYGGATPGYGSPAYGTATPNLALGGTSTPIAGSATAVNAATGQVVQQPAAAVATSSQMSLEQQYLMIEANRLQQQQQAQAAGRAMPPMPPTPLSQGAAGGASGAATTTPTVPSLPLAPTVRQFTQ